MKIIISSSPESLATAIAGKSSATVEAEYGAVCVEGSVLTLAHHGPRSGNPAPCLATNESVREGIDVIGVSHVDLDALGGVMAIMGVKPSAESFWDLAAFVDTHGAHKLGESNASESNLRALHAFWAWSEQNRCYPPRDGSAQDVTEYVRGACAAITSILEGDETMLAAGDAFRAATRTLNLESFKESSGRVVLRVSDSFVNHLYDYNGEAFDAVVAYNSKFKSVTVSFANPKETDDACKLVQSLWGVLAGGHKGIAGSPRGQEMTLEDAYAALDAITG